MSGLHRKPLVGFPVLKQTQEMDAPAVYEHFGNPGRASLAPGREEQPTPAASSVFPLRVSLMCYLVLGEKTLSTPHHTEPPLLMCGMQLRLSLGSAKGLVC